VAYECFEVGCSDGVGHVRLSRPDELNTMNRAFWRELPAIVRELDDAGEARVLVVSSTGRHFSAGMDLSVFQGGGATAGGRGRGGARTRAQVLDLQETFTCLEKARMPVLAAVQGGCIGGGLNLVAACDARYCTDDAFFCLQEINIGITADVGALQRLPHVMPSGLLRELAYTGRRLPAARALECGLVNEVYEDADAMLDGVLGIAREIAERSPLAVWGTKEMLNYARDHSVADGLAYIATWNAGLMEPADMAESFRARQEERSPRHPALPPLPRKLDDGE
jgi:enoyl-CoA hydratase